ncbi:di-trans,poly-cis-decaprenylcistransferase [Gongronella butleri]|nr:di-trans,poly-cis-decaprenylcistransferase [Gongronella butleri]
MASFLTDSPPPSLFQSYVQTGQEWLEKAAISVFKKGRIPRHVGFVMDGNRRFARRHGATSTYYGHYAGMKRLEKILDLCMELGIEEITCFAFSIANFERSSDEVAYLMRLFRETFASFCENHKLIETYGIRVRFIGDLSQLPPDLAEITQKVMEKTKENNSRVLNICCPYTSRDEMTSAIRANLEQVDQGTLSLADMDHDTIAKELFTLRPLDVLVRTSGEIRLSDFLLHQASLDGCQTHFVNCLWPDFSLWKMLPILLEYQIYCDVSKGALALNNE